MKAVVEFPLTAAMAKPDGMRDGRWEALHIRDEQDDQAGESNVKNTNSPAQTWQLDQVLH